MWHGQSNKSWQECGVCVDKAAEIKSVSIDNSSNLFYKNLCLEQFYIVCIKQTFLIAKRRKFQALEPRRPSLIAFFFVIFCNAPILVFQNTLSSCLVVLEENGEPKFVLYYFEISFVFTKIRIQVLTLQLKACSIF